MSLKWAEHVQWCVCSVSPLTSLPLHQQANDYQVSCSLLYWYDAHIEIKNAMTRKNIKMTQILTAVNCNKGERILVYK